MLFRSFRDVDVPGGTIAENISFLPYKEPSQTLYALLTTIVDEGRRFASLGDLKIADMNNEAPVGTTLALMERQMKVMSAIQSRLHAAMHKEFVILTTKINFSKKCDGVLISTLQSFKDQMFVQPFLQKDSKACGLLQDFLNKRMTYVFLSQQSILLLLHRLVW